MRAATIFSVIGWPVSAAVRKRSSATTSDASRVENSSGTTISVRLRIAWGPHDLDAHGTVRTVGGGPVRSANEFW